MFKKLIFFLFPLFAIAQHTVKGSFSPADDYKWVILYSITPTDLLFTANSTVDEKGNFTLQLDSTVTKGVYRLIYAVPMEVYNFDIIYDAEEDIEFTFDANKGVEFINSKENILLASYKSEMGAVLSEIRENYKNGYATVADSFEKLKNIQTTYEKKGQKTVALNFIKANKPYIPEKPEDLEKYIKNAKEDYFNQIDFTNPTLQKSSFLEESSFNYIIGFTNKEESLQTSYKKNIDAIYNKLKNNDTGFQKVFLHKLWQRFVNNGQTDLSNYITENYLIPLATSLGDEMLIKELQLSLGAKAPNFSWEEINEGKTTTQSLYNLDNAENYILVFWSSSCSHCLTEVPKLYAKINEIEKNNYKIIAVGLEDEPKNWQDKIKDFPRFTNVLGLEKWENKIGLAYDINATPTYFVLNKYKQITAKPEDVEALITIIETVNK